MRSRTRPPLTPADAAAAIKSRAVAEGFDSVRLTTLPDDALVVNGAGNFAVWVHRFFRYRRFGTQAAPVSGSMAGSSPTPASRGASSST